ncbi:unnamed protein product [Chrysoparadoxa australica]
MRSFAASAVAVVVACTACHAFVTPGSRLGVSSFASLAPRAQQAKPVCRPNVGPSMMFDQLTEAMGSIGSLLQGRKKITAASIEEALKEVKRALLDADVNLGVTNNLVKAVKAKAVGMKIIEGVTAEQQFIKVMYDELVEVMGKEQAPLARREMEDALSRPTVILLAGLQGAGKTTAAAKLAKYCQELSTHDLICTWLPFPQGDAPRKVLIVAGDIYRPAAIEQLQTLGASIDVEVFTKGRDVAPDIIATEGIEYAQVMGFDTVIIDTAGRQVIDDNLMDELKRVKVATKADETLLVVDAMTGQEAATLTGVFNDKIGITGAVLTKLDGDTRGGAALSVQGVSGRPIKFVGVGEKVDALEPFYPDRMASRILGMGDVVSLVEKAQKQVSDAEAQRITKKMMDASFDFNDFLQQSKMVKGMGSMANVAKMMPGVAGKINQSQLDEAEVRVAKAESFICSMTPKERSNPELLISDPTALSRLRRIARGAGRTAKEANQFISEFQKMRTMMSRMSKQMGGMGGGGMGMGDVPQDAGQQAAAPQVEMALLLLSHTRLVLFCPNDSPSALFFS